jgi:NTP pyrophosphatase (non-canonical NTP hydrolase)
MDNKQELLTILMEECAELSVEASKVIRFGYKKSDRLESEVGYVLCMIQLLQDYGLINLDNSHLCAEAKREKLKKWSNLDV